MTAFVDREDELERLQRLYDSEDSELAVVWGRRRIGKTRLVTESIRDLADVVYHQATETTPADQLESFVRDASESFQHVADLERDWETLLRNLIDLDAVVILDEFPYLVAGTAELPSLIQRLWDHEAADSAATLVLTGSSIGMMHDIAIEGGAPLYGRVSKTPSGRFPIGPLSFDAAVAFFPAYDPEDLVLAYGVYGGVPHYLEAVDAAASLGENITRTLLRSHGSLREEPEVILRMELEEVNRYFAILRAIASGKRTRSEIAGAAGIDTNALSYYLDRLAKLQILEPDHPVTADPVRTRNRRYRITDQLFRFWFRFVYGQEGRFEIHDGDAFEELIEPSLADFVSDTFEDLCAAATPSLYPSLSFEQQPGRWWGRGREIDVVGPTTDNTLLVGEAKFTSQPVGYDVLARLREDATHVDWTPTDGSDRRLEYALFARSGFNDSVVAAAEEDDSLRLFSLEDVVGTLANDD